MKSLILPLLLLASTAFAETPISFEKLQPGDSVDVTFTSVGCFHRVTYEFQFQKGGELTASVAMLDEGRGMPQAGKTPKRAALGKVTLSKDEIAGLDRLFAFYRSKQPGGCTTVDKITAVLKRGDEVKTSESFVDGTCATDEKKDFTLLTALAAKLTKSK